ncbi:aminotransferase class III-fold pyridoxal phosphate-dependent enzyme [Microbacterium sp. BWT-B31]|uniref:aspartate aminotransferase family protein n=1 Tax=Microbacterium sp. BWT-B31 TaxID=3232072 RepID=UPI0035290ED2
MPEPGASGTREQLTDRDHAVIAGVEKLRFFPLAACAGRGEILVEPGGRELLDLSASWTAAAFGHGNSDIAGAITRAVAEAPGASILSGTHPDAVALAEELLELVPSRRPNPERRVYLGHAGTDANEVALRGCRHATGRPGIIAFQNGYHGGFGAARAVSGVHVTAGVPADPEVVFFPYPDPYRPHTGDAGTVVEDVLARARRQLERGTTAAVIVEPVQSDGGVIVPPAGFLAGLRALCDTHGTYLVVDEVKVGLGRTGRTHAFDAHGILPDVVTLGKALGGGLPLSATVGPAEVLDAPVASALMTTIGNPVSCAAGRTVLALVRDGHATRNAGLRGAQFLAELTAYQESGRSGADRVGDVRGQGLAIGIELVTDRTSATPDSELTAKAVYRAWELGVVLYPVRGNVLEITPPLMITAESVDRAVRILTRAIDDAAQGAVSDDQIAAFRGWQRID